MERDPVCDMEVDPHTALAQSVYQGKTYYFCSMSCKQDFEADPEQYAERQQTTSG
jgi:Cu+-exporting ATPase